MQTDSAKKNIAQRRATTFEAMEKPLPPRQVKVTVSGGCFQMVNGALN
jgi:hypothetical protein